MQKWMLGLMLGAWTVAAVSLASGQHGGPATAEESTAQQQPRMRLYFTRFETMTYVPLTMERIEATADYAVLFFQPHPLIPKLEQTLQSRPTRGRRIDDNYIRLKVTLGKRTFFVDRNGTVLEQGSGRTFALTKLSDTRSNSRSRTFRVWWWNDRESSQE